MDCYVLNRKDFTLHDSVRSYGLCRVHSMFGLLRWVWRSNWYSKDNWGGEIKRLFHMWNICTDSLQYESNIISTWNTTCHLMFFDFTQIQNVQRFPFVCECTLLLLSAQFVIIIVVVVEVALKRGFSCVARPNPTGAV